MKIHEAEGYNKKEIENYREEATRYKCLEFQKNQSIPGPFTTPGDVRNYLEHSTDNPAKKNKRLYQEVTFACKSSKALKPTAAAFRLKRDGRNLDTSEYSDNLSNTNLARKISLFFQYFARKDGIFARIC